MTGFKEVASLDADVTIAIGKKDKKTGKAYPKTAEGYYLGKRTVEGKKGESVLHFLQTEDGNLGVWGTTDLNRKLSQVKDGVMVRITSTGTKPTKNGDMYTYKVEVDASNTIEVDLSESSADEEGAGEDDGTYGTDNEDDGNEEKEEDNSQALALAAAERAAQKAKVQEIMNRGKAKKA